MESGKLIIDILTKELGDNIKIAFCPYKREMFDCMKTVYEAAIEKGLTAYIIPLPYYIVYDMKVNLQSEPIIENIDGYSNISYKDLYNLNIDVIVFHNQYDGGNRLTCIDPKYHTGELKKKAKLAYIPYSPVKGNKNNSGAANCDYAFCIDEGDKEDWLKVYPDKKVYVVGSPKIELTEKYCKDKKDTVLIAASLIAFLNNPHKAMQRYKSIINHFDNTIFRPHPLMQDGINSMRPAYKNEYRLFLDWAKINTIIDYSIYPERVISMCDIMYADPGSLVNLWAASNKPYYILDNNFTLL